MPLSPDEKQSLLISQKEFVRARLLSDQAKSEWVQNVRLVGQALLQERVDRLVDLPRITRLLEESLAPATLEHVVAPLVTAFRADVLAWAKKESLPLGHFVPTTARGHVDAILEGKNLVPEAFIRAVIEHEALEGVMREVLHDTIREFNDKMNPFSSEFGIISMLKKMMPLGFGAVSKSIDLVRAEFEKRLEPELVKFLNTVSKRALGKMCTMTLDKWQEPEFITLRKSVAAFLYDQPLGAFVANVDETAIQHGQGAAHATLLHLSTLTRATELRNEILRSLLHRFGTRTLREVFDELKVDPTLPYEAFGEASWPIVSAALASPPVQAFLDALIEEFWATVPAS